MTYNVFGGTLNSTLLLIGLILIRAISGQWPCGRLGLNWLPASL